jgi:hypothetical protein
MSQVFGPASNNFARLSLLVGGLVTVLLLLGFFVSENSPYAYAEAGIAVAQPIRFSHELHSGNLNIDCRYCHGTAEVSSYGGIPDTHTCMSCHSQIAVYSELLEPVRDSYETGEPLVWQKVHDVAAHVYFNHSVHIAKGFGCETCHGQVDQMPLVWQNQPMTMNWCLECHREPEQFVRPLEEIYTTNWEPEGDQIELGQQLVEEYNINVEGLTNCSVCHR